MEMLYKSDNISVLGEINKEIVDLTSNDKFCLSLFFTIHINGKMKTFKRGFGFTITNNKIDNIDYFKFGDILNLLSDLGYEILEDRNDGNNYTGNIITNWIEKLSFNTNLISNSILGK